MRVTIRAPEGYYLYADETEIDFASLEGLFVTDIRYPKSTPYADPYLGKEVEVYHGDVDITISGKVPVRLEPGRRELVALIRYRGCSPTICYMAMEREVPFIVDVGPVLAEKEALPATPRKGLDVVEDGGSRVTEARGLKALLKIRDFKELLGRGLGLTLLIVFIAGILTSLTPCVWPVIPVVLLYIGVHPHKRFHENFALAALLVSGLVLVYSLLGIVAVALGKNLGFLFQQKIFLALVVVFFLAMSLSMFGAFDIKMPRRWHQRINKMGGEGYLGAFFTGMGIGLVASPCSGPVLAALLGHVALQGNYVTGFVLLVVFGIGMGLFVLLLGAGYGELAGKLHGGPWMVWIRRVLGVILLFPAAFYMGSLFRWSGEDLFSTGDEAKIEWVMGEEDALRFAQMNNRPIMMEFSAEWCPPCRRLDRDFFRRPEIVGLSYQLVPLRIDATFETKGARRLIEKYRVTGWPTVLFLDPTGKPYRDLRVGDYDPRAIERGMREAIRRTEEAMKDERRGD